MSCHRSSGSLRNWNIDYAELWSYLVVWERWLRGENVPLLSSNRLHSLPASQPCRALASLSQLRRRHAAYRHCQRKKHGTYMAHSGHGHEIRHLQCCYGRSRLYSRWQHSRLVRLRDAAPAATAATAPAAGSRRNTHLLIAKDPAKSHFNVGLICCRRPL